MQLPTESIRDVDRGAGSHPLLHNTPSARPVRFRAAKRLGEALLVNSITGRIIRRLLPHGIPYSGLIIANRAEVSDQLVARLVIGIYESGERRFIQRYLDPDRDVIEFGASIGVISCIIRRRLARGRRLLCCEANPRLIGCIYENLARNFPDSKPEVVHAAVDYGTRHETTRFEIGDSTLGSSLSRRPVGVAGPTVIEVPVVRLSELRRDFGLDEYSLVMDIEGAEIGLVCGDSVELAGCRQMIVELHRGEFRGNCVSVDDLSSVIQERHGFRLVDRRGSVCAFYR